MIVCLDAGHGGHDAGGNSLTAPEKEINLMAQWYLWQELAFLGHQCIPIRVADEFVEINVRAAIANLHDVDVFVSLHANAGPKESKGPWTIYARPSVKGKKLAGVVQAEMARATKSNPMAFYPDESSWVSGRKLGVLRQTRAPAILVELGFMTNPYEAQRLIMPSHIRLLAKAIAIGVHSTIWRS